MKKSEFRVIIKHYLRGKPVNETEEKLARYYKESAPSYGMVHKLFTELAAVLAQVMLSVLVVQKR